MKQQRCLLCGRESPTGLQIMGCLICFPCEKRLLASVSVTRWQRARLMALYSARAHRVS
ncbi:MAG: sigma factor G inhibitor Gin [Eubacteriales bacterium]|nr:sigma factor G inhibitor Gin [Eubacteriales bacterium]